MKNIVRLSEAVLIGIHGAAVIAGAAGRPVTSKRIAKYIDSSENHIAKVMQRLTKGGLLTSARGPAGGFTLGRKPEKITVFDIFKMIEGEEDGKECPFRRRQCVFNGCLFEGVIEKIESDFTKYMKNKTLADMRTEGGKETWLKEA